MNFSFTVTTSPEYLCLGDSVQLTCSAEGSATWRSDDILGPDQSISFLNGDYQHIRTCRKWHWSFA